MPKALVAFSLSKRCKLEAVAKANYQSEITHELHMHTDTHMLSHSLNINFKLGQEEQGFGLDCWCVEKVWAQLQTTN